MVPNESRALMAQSAAENSVGACGIKPNKYKPPHQREQVVELRPELIAARADRRVDKILQQLGVTDPNVRALCGLARIQTNGKFYEPHEAGEFGVIVPILDGDELVDLLAFDPRKPEQWWYRLGGERLLGSTDNQLLGKPLRVLKTPLSWLQAGCDGVVVLDPNRAFSDIVCAPYGVIGEDDAHTAELRRAMTKTAIRRLPRFLVREPA